MLALYQAIRDAAQKAIAAARRSPADAVAAVVLLGVMLWVYGGILRGIVTSALSNAMWYHCLVVPPAALWIWHLRRKQFIASGDAATPAEPWWFGGLALAFLAGLLRIGELGLENYYFGGTSAVVALGAVVALTRGKVRLKWFFFPIAFLIFAVPFPRTAYAMFAFPLQSLSAVATAGACRAMGMPVSLDGVVLSMLDFRATIADACSGMNSLFALFMIGAWVIGFAKVAWYHRAWMFAAIGPAVIAANILRLVIMMVVALFFNGDVALSFFHEGSDLVLFLIMASFLVALKLRVETGWHRTQPADAPGAAPQLSWVLDPPADV